LKRVMIKTSFSTLRQSKRAVKNAEIMRHQTY
jgi:hypothetical protein